MVVAHIGGEKATSLKLYCGASSTLLYYFTYEYYKAITAVTISFYSFILFQ